MYREQKLTNKQPIDPNLNMLKTRLTRGL